MCAICIEGLLVVNMPSMLAELLRSISKCAKTFWSVKGVHGGTIVKIYLV